MKLNLMSKTVPLITLFLLTACTPKTLSYEETIHSKFNIPFVFIPPNNAYHPYTLLHYTKDQGFQQICEATAVTGLSKEELFEKQEKANIASMGSSENHNAQYGVNLSPSQLIEAGISYQNIKMVNLSFENGQQISMPSISNAKIIQNLDLNTSECAKEIKLFNQNIENSKFYIPLVVFKYTMKYSILDKSGINITAGLTPKSQKMILANAGINLNQGEDLNISGEELYIGFRGLPLNTNGQPISKALENDMVLDVTDLVKRLKAQ